MSYVDHNKINSLIKEKPLMKKLKKILFVDLDETIRHPKGDHVFIQGPDDIEIYPLAAKRLVTYKNDGWKIYGVSNQGGVEAGFKTIKQVDEEMKKTKALVNLHAEGKDIFDEILYAPVSDDRRKPDIGMLHEIFKKEEINLSIVGFQCLMVGDMLSDMMCASNAGIDFIFAHDFRSLPVSQHNTSVFFFNISDPYGRLRLNKAVSEWVEIRRGSSPTIEYDHKIVWKEIQEIFNRNANSQEISIRNEISYLNEVDSLMKSYGASDQNLGEEDGKGNVSDEMIKDSIKRAEDSLKSDPNSLQRVRAELSKTYNMSEILRERPLGKDMEVDYILDQVHQPEIQEYFLEVLKHHLKLNLHQDIIEELVIRPADMAKMVELNFVGKILSNRQTQEKAVVLKKTILEPINWVNHRRVYLTNKISRIRFKVIRNFLSFFVKNPVMRERIVEITQMVKWTDIDAFPKMELPPGSHGPVVKTQRIDLV